MMQALGLPRFNCHCIGIRIINGDVNIVFGVRGDGSHQGEFDNVAGGKMDGELTRAQNMAKEILEETGNEIGINAQHDDGLIDTPTYLGTIYTLRQKKNFMFNRHISVFMWTINKQTVLRPNEEVKEFHSIPFDEFISNVRTPSPDREFPYFVPLDVVYAVAKYLKGEHDKGALSDNPETSINKHSMQLLNMIIEEAEKPPHLVGAARSNNEFIQKFASRLLKIAANAFGR